MLHFYDARLKIVLKKYYVLSKYEYDIEYVDIGLNENEKTQIKRSIDSTPQNLIKYVV